VLGDQLTPGLSSLRDIAPGDVVLLCELQDECTYVPHHPKKIVLVLAGIRHFAADLRARGIRSADIPGWRQRQIAAQVARRHQRIQGLYGDIAVGKFDAEASGSADLEQKRLKVGCHSGCSVLKSA